MTRPAIGTLTLALIAALILWDSAAAGLPDPFAAPPPVALGSGTLPAGAHCTGG